MAQEKENMMQYCITTSFLFRFFLIQNIFKNTKSVAIQPFTSRLVLNLDFLTMMYVAFLCCTPMYDVDAKYLQLACVVSQKSAIKCHKKHLTETRENSVDAQCKFHSTRSNIATCTPSSVSAVTVTSVP